MTNLNDIVELVHPTVSGQSVILSDQIWVLFDRELDEESVEANLFVAGPDKDTWSGPDLLLYPQRLQEGDESNILSSPNYRGFVDGTFTFEKINLADLQGYSGWDYGGHGTLWRTKAIFTPSKALTPNTEYYVYLSGDEDATDDLNTGIKTRTIFDTVNGANLGTGVATFTGSYSGSTSSETFHVKITTAGAAGTAKFVWYRGSAPLLTYGPFTAFRGKVALAEGVDIVFTSGTFEVNDNFSVVVKAGTVFTGNIAWPFTTGTGSVQELPSSVSTSLTGAPLTTAPATTTFEVEETDPDDKATNLSSVIDADTLVTVDFSQNVDAATATAANIEVNIEPVNGDESSVSSISASGIITPTISVVADKLYLTIPSGMINENNIVTITLDKDIASTDGYELGTDYSFYFTSTYNPMYSSWRRMMLDYGAYLSNFAKDTINLAIFEASITANNLAWATGSAVPYGVNDYYEWARREFVTCKAAETLLLGALGTNQGLKMKQLGDLTVQYDTAALEEGLNKALGCLGRWEATVHGKGVSKRKPMAVVKGDYDPNLPPTGRGWDPGSHPLATGKKLTGRRWNSGYYSPFGGTSRKGRTGK